MSHQFQNYQLVSHHKSPSKNIVQPVERLGPAGIWVKETGPMLNYSQGHSDLFQNCKRFKSVRFVRQDNCSSDQFKRLFLFSNICYLNTNFLHSTMILKSAIWSVSSQKMLLPKTVRPISIEQRNDRIRYIYIALHSTSYNITKVIRVTQKFRSCLPDWNWDTVPKKKRAFKSADERA